MSESNEQGTEGQGYLPGPGFGGAYGSYGAYPPPPPPPPAPTHHKRALVITGAAALVIGAAAGGVINSIHSTSAGVATATSKTSLTTSQIASRVDPGLVDVISTDG